MHAAAWILVQLTERAADLRRGASLLFEKPRESLCLSNGWRRYAGQERCKACTNMAFMILLPCGIALCYTVRFRKTSIYGPRVRKNREIGPACRINSSCRSSAMVQSNAVFKRSDFPLITCDNRLCATIHRHERITNMLLLRIISMAANDGTKFSRYFSCNYDI